jgi:hypothetical protein
MGGYIESLFQIYLIPIVYKPKSIDDSSKSLLLQGVLSLKGITCIRHEIRKKSSFLDPFSLC